MRPIHSSYFSILLHLLTDSIFDIHQYHLQNNGTRSPEFRIRTRNMYISTFELMMTFTRSGTFRARTLMRDRHKFIIRTRFRRRTHNTLPFHLIGRHLRRHNNSTLPLIHLTRAGNRRFHILTIMPRTNMTTGGDLFHLTGRIRRVYTNQYIRFLARRILIPHTAAR